MERRKHLRVRPTPDHEVGVEVVMESGVAKAAVVDVSMGGFGLLVTPALRALKIGETVILRVLLPRTSLIEVQAIVRHVTKLEQGIAGVEFVALSDEATSKLRRYVSELFERGAAV